ncbi:MAG: DinB family protein [Chitinophagaceae bacterium]
MKRWSARLVLLIFFYTFSFESFAQTNDSLLNQLSRKWLHAKIYVLKMAASMPAENFSFKPVVEVMSFQEQLLHIADNMRWLSATHHFFDTAKQVKAGRTMDKKEVLDYVAAAYDQALVSHHHISSAQLNEPVLFFAGPMTRRQILLLMHDHQTHHAGELILYLRLKGIKPPAYVGW